MTGSEFRATDPFERFSPDTVKNEKFEFPVNWGVDLLSEHQRYLTEK